MIAPRPEIAAYIAEIEQPGIPYVSNSHHTRLRLAARYGLGTVDAWIREYFDANRYPKDTL